MPKFTPAKIFKVIEWFWFFGLCGLSAVLMLNVLEKFLSGKSSFSQTEEPIATLPTITFCFYYDSDAKNTTEYIYGQG